MCKVTNGNSVIQSHPVITRDSVIVTTVNSIGAVHEPLWVS